MKIGRSCLLFITVCLSLMLLFCACGDSSGYHNISMEAGTAMMEEEEDAIILDVRTKEEYEESHIKGALLLPVEDIKEGDFTGLDDKDQLILIYCRTGRRAEDAAVILADNGYKRVYNFGGILEWKGETESGL